MACSDCIRYANIAKQDMFWNSSPCDYAASKGHLPCLNHWYDTCIYWWSDIHTVTHTAALHGSLDCLRFAHERGYQLAFSACADAAESGSLECLIYVHEHGAALYDEVTCCAADNGSLPCLIYAHEHGAPWHPMTCVVAAESGSLPCLRYAHAHGAPLPTLAYPSRGPNPRNHDGFRYFALHVPTWPDGPAEIIEWAARVRATAAAILRIVRFRRATRAARAIQAFWLDRHYTPGGRGATLALARLCTFALFQKKCTKTRCWFQEKARPVAPALHRPRAARAGQ